MIPARLFPSVTSVHLLKPAQLKDILESSSHSAGLQATAGYFYYSKRLRIFTQTVAQLAIPIDKHHSI
jgi:hypothetical protein